MASTSTFGIAHSCQRCGLAEGGHRLEGPLDCEIEQRTDEVVVLFIKSDRCTVAEAGIDNAIDRMEAVTTAKNVEHARPDRQAHDVFILDEGPERQGDIKRADDLGQEVVLLIMVIL